MKWENPRKKKLNLLENKSNKNININIIVNIYKLIKLITQMNRF